jgi:5-methylthioadenosine/S-adenosylhomocysteine deaminase
MYFFYQRGAQAMIESGIRACPGGVLLGFLPESERRIADALSFARDYRGAGDGRIMPFLAPHSLYTCNRAQWKTLIDGARDGDFVITTHIAETAREVAEVRAEWGATPLKVLSQIGALDGPLLAAHCVQWTNEDWQILEKHRDASGQSTLRVSHNPTSNLKLASGFAPIPMMLNKNLIVGLGTDGAASNNDLDMWEEMRLAALIHKAATGDATAVSARQALWMATRDGAKCLGLQDQIGTLETGKRADIILLNFDQPHLTPRHNVASHLVYAAKASDVETVLVEGKVLWSKGAFHTLDWAQIQHETAARAAKLAVSAAS